MHFLGKKFRLPISFCFFLLGLVFTKSSFWSTFFFLISYGIIGSDVIFHAIKNIVRGHVFDEEFLMTIATLGTFVIGEFEEGIMVMLFYQLGEYFNDKAVSKSKRSIQALLDLRSDYATVLKDGQEVVVLSNDVLVGDTILVRPGEKVPLDGVLLNESGYLDTSSLTGESLPRKVLVNEEVLSGSISYDSVLKIRVEKAYGDSTVSKMLQLVMNANEAKTNTEKFITRFSRIYTPIVVFFALLLFFIPTFLFHENYQDYLYRSLMFLVLSCPCALVISIPLSFFSGIGSCSMRGVFVKGANVLEVLSKTTIFAFDKTGTLTKGNFVVTNFYPVQESLREELISSVQYVEYYSNHPIAKAIKETIRDSFDASFLFHYKEYPGNGVEVFYRDDFIEAGSDRFLRKRGYSVSVSDEVGTKVHVALRHQYLGYVLIQDEIRENAIEVLQQMKSLGIHDFTILSGDQEEAVEHVSKSLQIDAYYSQLLPTDKVEQVNKLKKKGNVAFVGDGINDAAVLRLSDVGISLGGIGSDIAIEASDVVLMRDDLSSLIPSILISRKTLRIVKQNILFVLLCKGFFLLLSFFGFSSMFFSVFADVGVTFLTILNSLRILYIKSTNR